MSSIEQWIERISKPRTEIGNHSVCPYARSARYTVIETDTIDVDTFKEQVTVYVLPRLLTAEQLLDMCVELNQNNPDLVFLPDHWSSTSNINGVGTGNGEQNIILAQNRYDLEVARTQLSRGTYYDHWDFDYLEEILSL